MNGVVSATWVAFLILAVVGTLSVGLDASEKSKHNDPLPPHPQASQPEDVVLLKDEMQVLKKNYREVERALNSSEIDYESISRSLGRLEGAAQMIVKINTDPKFSKTFKHFQRDLSELHRQVRLKNRSGVENGMNELFQNCLGCHLTHVVLQGKRQEKEGL